MALQKLIKLAIFLAITLMVFNVLKKQSFFNIEPGQISSETKVSASADDNLIQNEQIRTQLHQLSTNTQTHYIAGCMNTQAGCKCYDARGKPVDVPASVCRQNVRDASGSQHKAFDLESH